MILYLYMYLNIGVLIYVMYVFVNFVLKKKINWMKKGGGGEIIFLEI